MCVMNYDIRIEIAANDKIPSVAYVYREILICRCTFRLNVSLGRFADKSKYFHNFGGFYKLLKGWRDERERERGRES
jgi:hypothetical protein